MIKHILIIIGWWLLVVITSAKVLAENNSLNLQIPNSSMSYQSDKFRAGDLDCSNAIGGATQFETGVTSIISNAVSPFSSEDPDNPMSKDIGIYARIIIPLDAPKERINCNTLFRIEMQKKRLEVQRLQQELDNLRKFGIGNQFEN